MEPLTQRACLSELWKLWLSASEELRPEKVWIAEHTPVLPDTDSPQTPVVNAWFLSKNGVERRSAIDYVRFMTVHSGLHWSSGASPPAGGIFSSRRAHAIGLAAFAPIHESELVYLHFIWAGAYGRGSRYRFDSEAKVLKCVQNVWLS